ncbi:MAG: apolipoprotein D and lipocalin family protein [Arenicella sp.]|jgi:apolipoprotein D and lipocalin family protein
MKTFLKLVMPATIALSLAACATRAPMPTVESVDLKKFMGDWYIIGNIPTFIERQAYNAVEHYELDSDGNIPTTFTFNKGSFDGPLKTYHPKGFVTDKTDNSLWGMQFIWPIKADYRIVYLSDDYQQVIVARKARDYVWIMARTPKISDTDYQALVEKTERLGYDPARIRKVPQQDLSDR